jgi:hypothetical protein
MKRWLLVDGNAKQPELFVEPVFRQNLFIVNTMQMYRRYFTINILYGLKPIKESARQPL